MRSMHHRPTRALERFDLESSLRQATFRFAGRVTTAAGVRV
jgi:hypothetical protein